MTNVSIDHVDYLGPTREADRGEKAGIIKPARARARRDRPGDPGDLRRRVSPRRIFRRDVDFGVPRNVLAIGGRLVDLRSPGAEYPDVFLPLHGAHQADNAAIALAAAECFVGGPLPFDVVVDAFARVQSPGRLEVVGRQPLVLLDGAHNVAGAEALRAALDEEWSRPRTLVVGFLREKDPKEMLVALGVEEPEGLIAVLPAADPRGARSQRSSPRPRVELGVPEERIEVVDGVGGRGRRSAARDSSRRSDRDHGLAVRCRGAARSVLT